MYTIIELQTTNGVTAIPPIINRDDKFEAESTFHQVCSVAAISSIDLHVVMMINEYGQMVRSEYYAHTDVPNPE